MIDNIDVNSIRQNDLRRNVGVILQNVQLFKGTIEDNIKINADDITKEDFFAASRLSLVDEFVGSCKMVSIGLQYRSTLISKGCQTTKSSKGKCHRVFLYSRR